jgi:hypothetical protein
MMHQPLLVVIRIPLTTQVVVAAVEVEVEVAGSISALVPLLLRPWLPAV